MDGVCVHACVCIYFRFLSARAWIIDDCWGCQYRYIIPSLRLTVAWTITTHSPPHTLHPPPHCDADGFMIKVRREAAWKTLFVWPTGQRFPCQGFLLIRAALTSADSSERATTKPTNKPEVRLLRNACGCLCPTPTPTPTPTVPKALLYLFDRYHKCWRWPEVIGLQFGILTLQERESECQSESRGQQ